MYNKLIDGDWREYRAHVIASLFFGLLGSLVIMRDSGFNSISTPSVLLVCTLVPTVMHGLRLTNPYVNGRPLAESLATNLNRETWRQQWDFHAPDLGTISVGPSGSLDMTIHPWASASIRAKNAQSFPIISWQIPLGATRAVINEEVDLTVTAIRTGNYLGILQANRTRIQVVSYGIKVTVPDERGDVVSVDIPIKSWADDGPHRWQLNGKSATLSLKLDGAKIWEGKQREGLEPVFIGDTQSDNEHGGSLSVDAARFTRRLSIGSP